MKQHLLVNGNLFTVKPGVDVEAAIAKLKAKGKEVIKVKKPPSLSTLARYMDGIASATDGCRVEPDGTCQHGHKSWLLVMGMI